MRPNANLIKLHTCHSRVPLDLLQVDLLNEQRIWEDAMITTSRKSRVPPDLKLTQKI